MYFSQICIGDMFNTMTARWVKTSDKEAICVMSALVELGKIIEFNDETPLVLLWSAILKCDV